jgi:hypothetical protein
MSIPPAPPDLVDANQRVSPSDEIAGLDSSFVEFTLGASWGSPNGSSMLALLATQVSL